METPGYYRVERQVKSVTVSYLIQIIDCKLTGRYWRYANEALLRRIGDTIPFTIKEKVEMQ